MYLIDLQGQLSSRGLECDLLRKKLAAADGSLSNLRLDLQESQQEANELRQQMQAMESAAVEAQAAADERVRRC